MIQIALCDDEANIRKLLKQYLLRFSAETGQKVEVLEYASADQLLQNYPVGLDLLLLDIYMDGVDGMEAAKTIRTFDPQVCILFITTMYHRAIDGYAVRAFGFIKKPISYAELSHELSCAFIQIEQQRAQERFILLRSGGTVYRLPVSRISYCEVRDHSMRVCIDGRISEYRQPMKELENQLRPYGFLRCHASYIVNARKIRAVEPTHLVLEDGASIPISQRRKRDFLSALSSYIGAQI